MMFDQDGYTVRFEWGPTGIRRAAQRGDIVIVVDVLRFSSAVAVATGYGATLFPAPYDQSARDYAERLGLPLINAAFGSVADLKSLSPSSFGPADAGRRYVISSANGAACASYAGGARAVIAGALLNAQAVAARALALQSETGAPITAIACGERWGAEHAANDRLRPCLEDYLGAGAILSALRGPSSPEAQVSAAAFQASRPNIEQILWECGSGRELRERGQAADVEFCARLDSSSSVPLLRDGGFSAGR
jgi:2-phosphosulfolactate phosphatase